MNEEIMKLAKAEWSAGDLYIGPDLQAIERIYHAAFNAGLEAAAELVEEGNTKSFDLFAAAIRKLKEQV